MTLPVSRSNVYLIGIVLFAAVYYQVKQALGGGLVFFLASVAYLVTLSLIAHRFGKKDGGTR